MGRSKRYSGGHTIQHAEELFQQSVEAGKPDYGYVALAIGASPASPPPWAMLACIDLRQQSEQKAARGNSKDIEVILDDVVRFYEERQRKFEERYEGQDTKLATYSPPSLRSAILHVLKASDKRNDKHGNASDDWFRDIREAWEWEQANDVARASFMDLNEPCRSENERKLKTTSRIDRVLMRIVAAERGDPEDPHRWAWLTKVLIETENVGQQKPDQPIV